MRMEKTLLRSFISTTKLEFMPTNLKITLVSQSRRESVDFDNLPFGQVFSDHMFTADFDGEKWTNFEIKPLENLSVHPGNLAWHYGQAIFEGMKASKSITGTPLLFRPEMHIQRLNASATRMCMPEFPEDMFIQAVNTIVDLEKKWIPEEAGSALYIRPFMIAMDEALGVRPSALYKFMIICLPVGPYYSKPVSLKAETTYVRAVEGGVGEAKTAGNYAGSLYPARLAKQEGFDQIMWLDAKEFKYIQEVGTMNIFFVLKDRIITPSTTGTILKGITRDTFIQVLRDKGYMVEERRITIDEIYEAFANGELLEVFGSGTAAVMAKVKRISYKGKEIELDPDSYKIGPSLKAHIEGLRNQTIEDNKGWVIPVQSLETIS